VSWLDERQRNGGIDEVPLPAGASGRLWLCGKHLIGPDAEAAVARVAATTVVCLNPERELAGWYDGYVAWLRANAGERAVWFPIADLHAPAAEVIRPLLEDLHERLAAGGTLLVHCGAGIGRAGTVAAALLIGLGQDLDEALATVAASRPMAGPQDPSQLALLRELAGR
jgi:protein-tyrosine phosphatase